MRCRKTAKWERKQPALGVWRRFGPMREARLFPHRAKTATVPSFSARLVRTLRGGLLGHLSEVIFLVSHRAERVRDLMS